MNDTTRPALTIERIPLADLTPHPRNVREGDVGAIAESLGKHGLYRPIVVQRATPEGDPRMVVLAGNHTFKAALALAWDTIDAVLLDVSDERGVGIMLTDNRTADLGRNDESALFAILRDMDERGAIELTSYTRDDVDDLLRDLERLGEDPTGRKGNVPLTDPDETPEPPARPYVNRGDLWLLGEHRLMCGDSTEPADVARLIGDRRIALVATDPPYGIGYSAVVDGRANRREGGWEDILNDGGGNPARPRVGGRHPDGRVWLTIENDSDEATAAGIARAALLACQPYAAEGCAILVWVPSMEGHAIFRDAVSSAGVHILKVIVWVKPHFVFGRHEYHWRHETALYGWWEGNRAAFLGERSETTVWEVDYSPGYKVRNGPALHPTQKPVELTARPVRNHTRPGDVVYDPFVGSGSALIAAEDEGRVCLAMDLDPGYAQTALERWQRHTGRTATLEDPTP